MSTTKPAAETECGMLFRGQTHAPHDPDGCRLPEGHEGPHEFVSDDGAIYGWRTDWSCECDACISNLHDYCTIIWPSAATEAACHR